MASDAVGGCRGTREYASPVTSRRTTPAFPPAMPGRSHTVWRNGRPKVITRCSRVIQKHGLACRDTPGNDRGAGARYTMCRQGRRGAETRVKEHAELALVVVVLNSPARQLRVRLRQRQRDRP